MTTRILIVDDEANIRRMVGALLKSEEFEVAEAANGNAALLAIPDVHPDIILLDLMMPPGPDGLATLERIRAADRDVPVIMMSGKAQLADAVRAVQMGAFQFLEKPLAPESLLVAVRSAETLVRTQAENRALRQALGPQPTLVGTSSAIEHVRQLIAQVAPTDARVLILGESGTGKELVANAIHRYSPRARGPFVSVNCAAIPRDLVESEMFGHERGAFTGATDRRIGRFELAHRGTLFLDEVGDLGAEAQAKLLRAIEAKEIERVGGGKPVRVDVRIVSATNKDLARGVVDGAFREDLLFRLDVIPIPLPPLRDRPGDIPSLVRHFAALHRLRTGQAVPDWTEDAIAALSRHRWPGNVRELANIIERLAILHAGRRVTEADVAAVLPLERAPRTPTPPTSLPLPDPAELESSLSDTLDDYERTLISRALSMAGGNVAEAARRLRTDRPNLYRRMRRLGIAVGAE